MTGQSGFSGGRSALGPGGWALDSLIAPGLLADWQAAETGLARLDQALCDADPTLRAAWMEATRLDEVIRAGDCEGRATTLERVAVLEADSALGLIAADDRFALALLTAHRSLDRADPAELLSARGLADLYARGFHDPGERPEPFRDATIPVITGWLDRVAPLLPGDNARDAPPGPTGLAFPAGVPLPGLAAPAALLGEWRAAAALDGDSAGFGRLLVPVLAWRFGLTSGPILMLGDRLERGDGRAARAASGAVSPGAPVRHPQHWLAAVFAAVTDATSEGARRLASLRLRRERWLSRLGRRRRNSRLAAAAQLALATPMLSGRLLMERLGLSPRGATLILAELSAAGILREVTGRSRFRLYTAGI